MKTLRPIAIAITAAFVGLLLLGPSAPAGSPPGLDCEEACDLSCRRCGGTCRPIPKPKTVSKHCWRVEWKQVCIPAVQPPWSKWWRGGCDCEEACDGTCSAPRCGRTRWVRVLVKEKYECEKCGCEWIIEADCDECTTGAIESPPTPLRPSSETIGAARRTDGVVRVGRLEPAER